jgi:hypothetical protein
MNSGLTESDPLRRPRYPRPRTIKEQFGPASQAEMYLSRALQEFHRSANPPDLWVPVDALHRDSIVFEAPQAVMNARNLRLQFLRGTVLFSAVSAEAFTNELLDELLTDAQFDDLDRCPTLEKLVDGIKLATGATPVNRGSEPLQGLRAVLKTRDALVHPKPRDGVAAWERDIEPSDEARVGPKAALDAILRVAETAVACQKLWRHPSLHSGLAKTVIYHRRLIETQQELAGETITSLPPRDADGVPSLNDQMMEVVMAGARKRAEQSPSDSEPPV